MNVKRIVTSLFTLVMMVLLFGGSFQVFAADDFVNNEKSNSVDNTAIEDDRSEVEFVYLMDNIHDEEKTLFVKETIVNSAGKEFELLYPYEIQWPETEEEILACYITHEGGTTEEQTLIAAIVAGRLIDPAYPDNIKDILCQKGHFYLNIDVWNRSVNPSEEAIAIAKSVLESPEVPMYKHYDLIEFVERMRPLEDCYVLEHFAFFN